MAQNGCGHPLLANRREEHVPENLATSVSLGRTGNPQVTAAGILALMYFRGAVQQQTG